MEVDLPKQGTGSSGFPFLKEGVTVEIDDDTERETFYATSPSGSPVPLLCQQEVEFYTSNVDRYESHYSLSNISDLLELDRVLLHELMVHRWGQWVLNGGLDYHGNPVDIDLNKNIREYSKEIRDLKSGLGIDKKTRELSKGGNTANFINTLLLRAEEFGYHRNEQVIEAYTRWKELQGLLTLHKNCTPSERSQFKCREIDIMEFIEEKAASLDLIDEKFREEKQRYWIRELG